MTLSPGIDQKVLEVDERKWRGGPNGGRIRGNVSARSVVRSSMAGATSLGQGGWGQGTQVATLGRPGGLRKIALFFQWIFDAFRGHFVVFCT